MRLVMHSQAIAVVGLAPGAPDPDWARGGPLVSITRTEHETSVICPTSSVPEDVPGPMQGPLVGVYVDERLDFSQAGILVGLLKPLADVGIPVLTVSTYDTDWVLLESSKAAAAASVWRAAGYHVIDAVSLPTTVDLADGLDDDVIDTDALATDALDGVTAGQDTGQGDAASDHAAQDSAAQSESGQSESGQSESGQSERQDSPAAEADRVIDVRDPVTVPGSERKDQT